MEKPAQLFKALADPTRLRLLALLQTGELCVCQLMAVLDLPQSTVSRHLAYLRNAGWVKGRREGVWMYYRMAPAGSTLQESLRSALDAELKKLPEVAADREALKNVSPAGRAAECG